MGCIVAVIVAGILVNLDVISVGTFGLVAFGSVIWLHVGACLYFRYGFLNFFYHGLMGWHRPDKYARFSDGCSIHSRCRYCKKEIMQDSQGNWFTFE